MQTKQAQKVLSQIELDSFLETYIKMAEYGEAEKLLKKGAKLNLSIQEDGLTLLHQAVLNNDRQMLIFLLDNGVDPAVSNRVGKERARAIELVADTDWETYLIFATHGKDKGNARYDKALFNAILHDRCDVAEALLKAGASLSGDHVDDKYGRVKLIHVAAKIGNLNMVQLLLAYKADLASLTFHRKIKRGRAPIEILARYGHWDCVKWIADRTANTLTSEKYNFGAVLLDLAILTEENFKRQVEAANSKRPPEEALNQHAIAHSLLKAGANPNSWTLNGAHPLHYAASNGNSYLISLLLNYGANNAKQDSIQPVAQPRVAIQMVPENDWDSYTAFARYQKDKGSARYHIGLLSAILHGRVSLAGEFIKAGAKLSERYSDNESDYYLIHVAIEHGNIQMIDLLISASPNCLTFNRLDKKTAVSQKPMQILANKVEALENELAATRKKINELDHNLSKFDRESLVENERGIRKDLERYLHCIHWIAKKQRDTSEFYYDYGYALLTTVRHGYSNLALSLLQAGANPARRVDSTLDTPLHIAVIMKNLQMILLLLKFNPQAVRITNAAKKTPLQLASDMQDVAIINCFTHEDLKFETTDDKIVLANLYAALHQPLMEKDESENEEEKEREESKSQEKEKKRPSDYFSFNPFRKKKENPTQEITNCYLPEVSEEGSTLSALPEEILEHILSYAFNHLTFVRHDITTLHQRVYIELYLNSVRTLGSAFMNEQDAIIGKLKKLNNEQKTTWKKPFAEAPMGFSNDEATLIEQLLKTLQQKYNSSEMVEECKGLILEFVKKERESNSNEEKLQGESTRFSYLNKPVKLIASSVASTLFSSTPKTTSLRPEKESWTIEAIKRFHLFPVELLAENERENSHYIWKI